MRRIIKHTARKIISVFRAFTLIEILIGTAILACLGLIMSTAGRVAILKARDTQRKNDLEFMRIALDESYDAFGYYPSEIPECGNSLQEGNAVFLNTIPCDPKIGLSYRYVTDATEQSGWYKLYTNLEYTEDAAIDNVGCRTGCGTNCQYNYGIASTNVEIMGCSVLIPTLIPTPSPMPVLYVCAPGGGQSGSCEAFDDPERSECPKAYPDDPTCMNKCSDKKNRCKNASGKHKPN